MTRGSATKKEDLGGSVARGQAWLASFTFGIQTVAQIATSGNMDIPHVRTDVHCLAWKKVGSFAACGKKDTQACIDGGTQRRSVNGNKRSRDPSQRLVS